MRDTETSRRPVLLVEDDADILDMARELLEQKGHRVVTAANGEEALKCLERIERPCVILLDLFMPVMNGVEFLRALRGESDPRLAHLPVVVVSAAVGSTAEEAGRMADGFLHKPVPVASFLDTVSRYCESCGGRQNSTSPVTENARPG